MSPKLADGMRAEHGFEGERIWFWVIWLLALAALPAHGQTNSAQLTVNLTVQSSISLVFNNNPSVGNKGFCPLTNAGTNNVGLDLGTAAYPGNFHSSTCVNYAHVGNSFYQVSSAFDVLVTKSNSSSPTYNLAAQLATAPPANVLWLVNNIPLNNVAFTPLSAANKYGQPVTDTLQVLVRNDVNAGILLETITFVATAN